uniref:ShKT domain-containing protein n=1 Tax=Haemonchus contortus TaxID=6289 RepID=A0A7I5E9H9_HAECO
MILILIVLLATITVTESTPSAERNSSDLHSPSVVHLGCKDLDNCKSLVRNGFCTMPNISKRIKMHNCPVSCNLC